MQLHQTQHFENLLQVERKTISLFKALGLQKCQQSPIKLSQVKAELPEIDEDFTTLISKLAFVSLQDDTVVPVTHQIFSAESESLTC